MSRIRTAAGRWKQAANAAGVDAMPPHSQLIAVLMFFRGFQAALDAAEEIGRLSTDEAGPAFTELKAEVATFHQIATAALANGNTPH